MIHFSDTIEDAIRAHGMNPPVGITPGKFFRFPGAGKENGNQAGWCRLFDDWNGGVIGDYSRGLQVTWQKSREKPLTPEEKEALQRQAEETRRELERERAAKQAKAATTAQEIWEKSCPADRAHPYLIKKGVPPYEIRQADDGKLLIPLLNADGTISSIQYVDKEGRKLFLRNGRISGCYFLVGAIEEPATVFCICEGYATGASIHMATCYPVAVAFNAGNLQVVAVAIREQYPDTKIIVCADDDHYTDKNPGITKATEAALAIDGWLARPDFGEHRQEWPEEDDEEPAVKLTDFNDLHKLLGQGAVLNCIDAAVKMEREPEAIEGGEKEAPQDHQISDEEAAAIIQRLASLPELQYERTKDAEAKNLGIKPAALDKFVKAAKKKEESSTSCIFEDIEPWPSPVNVAELLGEISMIIQRFVICPVETAHAVALWSALTWVIDYVQVAPLAVITSPEPRCGKSMLLFLLGRLVARPILSSNISPADLFRAIEAWRPTLLIDEADTFVKENEELRGIINSGHTRDSAYIIRTVGENFTPTKFNTWGAKAIAGIGRLPATIMDRAVILEMRRRLPDEQVEKLRYAEEELFANLRSKLARFAEDNAERIKSSRPILPNRLNDRAQDNWEPLFAIADIAGGDWPEKARGAALKLSASQDDNKSVGIELLADIREIFDARRVGKLNTKEKIGTAELIEALVEDEEKPWATFNRGIPIKPRQVSKRLAEYGITSGTIRIGSVTKKGYKREQFEEAFARYLNSSATE